MTFEVAASVAAAPVSFVMNINDDLRPGGFGTGVVRVTIRDNDVGKLRFRAADLVGLLQREAEIVFADGAEHNHAGTKGELGVGDSVVWTGNNDMFFETESFAEPFDCRRGISITQAGDNR